MIDTGHGTKCACSFAALHKVMHVLAIFRKSGRVARSGLARWWGGCMCCIWRTSAVCLDRTRSSCCGIKYSFCGPRDSKPPKRRLGGVGQAHLVKTEKGHTTPVSTPYADEAPSGVPFRSFAET